MSNTWDRFDFVGVARYIPNGDRAGRLGAELRRVGLAERAVDFWDYETPLREVEMSAFRIGSGIRSPGMFGCAMNHYRMWKTALGLGHRHALFLEDDVRFLSDEQTLSETVGSLPDDFDVALLDWFATARLRESFPELASRPREGGHWADVHGHSPVSCGCYALSRRGMEWITGAFEHAALHRRMRAADMFFRPKWLPDDVRALCAFPHVAVQGAVATSNNAPEKDYASVGVDTEDYE